MGESIMLWSKDRSWIGFHSVVLGIAFLLMMMMFLGSGSATAATTHYVAANGSDSNNGTSKATPWLHAPGMPNCTGGCASYAPSAGDRFILRGGDTWHFGNSSASPYTGGKWAMDNWAGNNATCLYESSTSGCIYWGVDKTWFSGASWTRPIMNGDNPTSTSLVASCAYQTGASNNAAAIYNGAWIDNFEFTGFCSSRNPASTNPSQDIVVGYSGTGNVFETNLYIHGWTATTAAGSSNNTIPCTLLGGSTQSTAQQFITGIVIDGSDSNPGACAWGLFPTFTHFTDSMIRYTTQGVGQGCHDIHDNIFEHIHNPNLPTHGNILECNAEANGNTPNVFYNNIMRHIDSRFFGAGQVGWWFCPNTATDYWFNNTVYDTGGLGNGNLWAVAGATQYPNCTNTGTQKMFNNTLSGAIQICHLGGSNPTGGKYLTVLNEHLINTPYDGTGCTGGASDPSNVSMTWAAAHTQGYTTGTKGITDADTCANDSTTPCAPASNTNATVGAGENHQGYCTALAAFSSEPAIGTDAANACKYGTTDGCAYDTSAHAMVCPAQSAVARPPSDPWDSGAYQYASGGSKPNAPSGLTAVVE
jgi:hypothetical protein